MSRVIESLKRAPSKERLLHEHIASTYFYKKSHEKKRRSILKRPAVISLCACIFILSGLAIFALPRFQEGRIDALRTKLSRAKVIPVFNSGVLNNDIIKKMTFRGHSQGNSGLSKDSIILNNLTKYDWADLSIEFAVPIDLTHRAISASLKGSVGGERLVIAVKDASNRSSRLGDIYATSQWRTETIGFDSIKKDIDLTRVALLRFEYGRVGESAGRMDEPIDITIYMKSMNIY